MSEGIKKVAAFLSGLDCKTVDVLIRRFDEQTAAAIRKELLAMSDDLPEASRRAATEFKRSRMGHTANRIDTFESSAAIYAPPNRLPQREFRRTETDVPEGSHHHFSSQKNIRGDEEASPAGVFAFLRETPARQAAKMLLVERPQTIALVLAHLESDTAAELLAQLPLPMQVETMRALHDLEEIDDDILLEVESSLRERLREMAIETRPRRRIGTEAAKRIIMATDPKMRTAIFDAMRPADPISERNHVNTINGFESLEELSDDELALLFASVDRRIGMVALVGASQTLIDRIVGRYTPAQQRRLHQQLTDLAPIRETDIRDAREIVLREAERLGGRMLEFASATR